MRRDRHCICKHLLGEKYTKVSIYLQTPVNCLPSRFSTWINDKHSTCSWLDEPSVCIYTILLQKEHLILYSVSQAKAWTVGLKSLERGAVMVSGVRCGVIRIWYPLLGMLLNIQGKTWTYVEGLFVGVLFWGFFGCSCCFFKSLGIWQWTWEVLRLL